MFAGMNGANPLIGAIGEGFGDVIRQAVKDELAPLLEQISTLQGELTYYRELIEAAKSNNGIVARLFLGGK